jgi:hypothetical protein
MLSRAILNWRVFNNHNISLRPKLFLIGFLVLAVFSLGYFPLRCELNNILTIPQESIATFPKSVDDNQKVTFSYGNLSFIFTISDLKNGEKSFFDMAGYYPFLAYVDNGNLFVDVTTTGNSELGLPAITINNNIISGQPHDWDVNYKNGYAAELVNEKQEPIIQKIYDGKYHITINGFITFPSGFAFTDGKTTYFNQLPDTFTLKRIFKYPSYKYLNILDK